MTASAPAPVQQDRDRVLRKCQNLLSQLRLLWQILSNPRSRRVRNSITEIGKFYADIEKKIPAMDAIDLQIYEEDIDDDLLGIETTVKKWIAVLQEQEQTTSG